MFNRVSIRNGKNLNKISDNIFTSETAGDLNITDEKGEEKNTFTNVTA